MDRVGRVNSSSINRPRPPGEGKTKNRPASQDTAKQLGIELLYSPNLNLIERRTYGIWRAASNTISAKKMAAIRYGTAASGTWG